jgi:hypothetical protein
MKVTTHIHLLLELRIPGDLTYILESNPHPFYSFRGLKNQMQIRFAVKSWILEKLSTADNSTTFVQNLLGAFGISVILHCNASSIRRINLMAYPLLALK